MKIELHEIPVRDVVAGYVDMLRTGDSWRGLFEP